MRRAALTLALTAASVARADEPASLRRFALVIGSNDGGADRIRLRYANTDAAAMAGVLRDLGGVAPADLVQLVEPGIDEISNAFDVLSARIVAARPTAQRVEVVVYYSGHADEDGLLPRGQAYPYQRLRTEVARLDADVRISVLDSCSSGAFLRSKGGVRRAPFLVDQGNAVRGEAFLTSSTADEASQESDRIGASFFTHHLVAALRGAADADADGRVTLGEAYTYTFRETRESTENSRIGPQSPNWWLDLVGQGDFVVTDLREASSRLTLDVSLDGDLWLRDARGRLVAEVDKVPGKRLTLSLPPGPYRVTLRSTPDAYVADVVVRDGAPALLDADDFRKEQLADTRARGDVASQAPERTRHVDFQVVGRPQSLDARTRVEGSAFHLLGGQVHSLRGTALSLFSTSTTHGMDGAQLAMAWTRSGGDARGFQGSMLANVVGGSLTGAQGTAGVNVILGDSPEGIFATQLAGVGNVARGGRRGAQLSTLFNVNIGHLTGGQLTSGVNVSTGGVAGAQLASIGNVAKERVDGAQWSMLFNAAQELRGAQLGLVNQVRDGAGLQAGLFNVARRMRGVQLGLLNVAEDLEGESLALVTIARNGYHAFEVWSDDLAPVSLGFKFGSRHIYTALVVGIDPVDRVGMSFGGGLGGHATFFGGRMFLDADVIVRTLEVEPNRVQGFGGGLVTSGRLMVGGDVVGPFGLFLGPALHVTVPLGQDGTPPLQSFMPAFQLGPNIAHIGYQAGLRVRF